MFHLSHFVTDYCTYNALILTKFLLGAKVRSVTDGCKFRNKSRSKTKLLDMPSHLDEKQRVSFMGVLSLSSSPGV